MAAIRTSGQPEHGRPRQRRRHRRVGLLGVHHRSQPDGQLYAAGPGAAPTRPRRRRPPRLTAPTSASTTAAPPSPPPPPPPPSDTTPPDTTITSGPTGTTNDNTPTFAFTATEANSVFECRVDSGRLGRLHQPVDDGRPERRRAQRLGPRDRRGGQHRRLARRRARSRSAPRRRPTRRRPTRRSRRARRARPRTTRRPSRSPRPRRTRSSSAASTPAAWADCTSPWTTAALERRRALGLRPRHRRGGQHRRLPGDALVHRRHGHAAADRHDAARHDDQLGPDRHDVGHDRLVRVHLDRVRARPSSASSIPAPGRPARARRPTAV